MHGDDISVGRLCEIKHFHPEFITHPRNKSLFGLYQLDPLSWAGQAVVFHSALEWLGNKQTKKSCGTQKPATKDG